MIMYVGILIVLDYINYVYLQGANPLRWDLVPKVGVFIVVVLFFL